MDILLLGDANTAGCFDDWLVGWLVACLVINDITKGKQAIRIQNKMLIQCYSNSNVPCQQSFKSPLSSSIKFIVNTPPN